MALANIKAPGKRIAAPEIPQNRPGCGWRPAPPQTYVFRFRGSGCGVVKSFLGGRAAAPLPMYIIMGSAANKTAHCPRFCTAAAHKTRGELSLRVLGNARAVRPIFFFLPKTPFTPPSTSRMTRFCIAGVATGCSKTCKPHTPRPTPVFPQSWDKGVGLGVSPPPLC